MTAASELAVFVLGEEPDARLQPVMDLGERWKELPHLKTRSRGFVLIPGEYVESPVIALTDEHRLRLDVALGTTPISRDGLRLNISAVEGGQEIRLGSLSLLNEVAAGTATRFDLSLATLAGRAMKFVLACDAGPENEPDSDWAAICSFVVAPSDSLELATATSHYQWRARNEMRHFTDVYDGEIYGSRRGDRDAVSVVERRRIEPSSAVRPATAQAIDPPALPWAPPQPKPGDTSFHYASRLLARLLPRTQPDFPARLARRAPTGNAPRVLSLCAGEAGIEGLLLRKANVPVDVTLMDFNATMLERARSNIPSSCTLRLWEGDVRDIPASISERFDVIMFVAGLHHVVHLEEVLEKVAFMLADQGEFWLVGEQVGRNGNRLWPDAYRVANQLFASLPAHLRFNRHLAATDAQLANADCSLSSFEGVRSQEILPMLRGRFVPVQEDLRNCFMWRLVESTYGPNFRLDDPDDIRQLERIVRAEYDFWLKGGLSTELNGVYRLKDSA